MTILWFLLLIGPLITIHELGHFLVAKLTGVRVLTFSLGFGPRLFGFTRGDTEYRISALPLGGYVRMYGDDVTAEVPAHERHYAFLEKPFLAKVAIAVAGPLANFILPVGVLFAMHVGEEEVPDAVVGSVVAGDVADLAGVRPGDRITAVEGKPTASFEEVFDAVRVRPEQATRLSITRGSERFDVVVTPRKGDGRVGMLNGVEAPQVFVAAGSPAARAGVQTKDKVLSVDGTPVTRRGELLALLAQKTGDVVLVVERQEKDEKTEKEQPLQRSLTVPPAAPPSDSFVVRDLRFAVLADEMTGELRERQERTQVLVEDALRQQQSLRGLAPYVGTVDEVIPELPAATRGVIAQRTRVVAVNGAPLQLATDLSTSVKEHPDAPQVIGLVDGDGRGAVFSFRLQPSEKHGGAKMVGLVIATDQIGGATFVRHVSPGDAFVRALEETRDITVLILTGLWQLLTGQAGLDQLGGPVLIANVAGEAAEAGPEYFLRLMAMFSVNLGVLNLLPIPVLDGGHVLLFIVEAVRRKKLSPNARIRVTQVGLAVVGVLMLFALFNDVNRIAHWF